jgi:hypothetical protein
MIFDLRLIVTPLVERKQLKPAITSKKEISICGLDT